MSHSLGYLVAAALPIAYIELPALLDLLARRIFAVPGTSTEVRQHIRQWSPHIALAVMAMLMWSVARDAALIAAAGRNVRSMTALGLLIGLSWSALSFLLRLLVMTTPTESSGSGPDAQLRTTYWLPLIVTAPLVEELWRVYCLVAMGDRGTLEPTAITAAAFAWAHARSAGTATRALLFGLLMAGLFWWKQSLLSMVITHLTANICTFVMLRNSVNRAPRVTQARYSEPTLY